MIILGEINQLKVLRETSIGLYLGDDSGQSVLLPQKYVPDNLKIDDFINVFVYLDGDERMIATTLKPKVRLKQFAFLRVVQVNNAGAFLDWGLEKHLLAPFREQAIRMEEQKSYIVYLYLDDQSQRLAASSRVNDFLSNQNLSVKEKDEVEVMIWKRSDLGTNVIVNHKHRGLIYDSNLFKKVKPGDVFKAYVQKIREDNKLDIVLEKPGYATVENQAEKLLQMLEKSGGFLPLNDKSDPNEIADKLEMSKKAFKKASGMLYKQKKIELNESGIYLKRQ